MAGSDYGDLRVQRERCLGLVSGLQEASRTAVMEALEAAKRWHAGQFRGRTRFPYVTHVYHVVSLLIGEMEVTDPEVLAAASLHDVIEDCGVDVEELTGMFGPRVSAMVASESENLFGSRKEYMEHFRTAGRETVLIKVADRIDNLRFLAHKGVTAFRHAEGRSGRGKEWSMKKVARYVFEAETYLLPYSREAAPEGFRELDRLVREFKESTAFVRAYRSLGKEGTAEFRD